MTRETKIGLLVGLAFIIVIGILLSDYNRNESQAAALNAVAADVQKGAATPHNGASTETAILPPMPAPARPVPTHEELHPPVNPAPPAARAPVRPPAAPVTPVTPAPPAAPVTPTRHGSDGPAPIEELVKQHPDALETVDPAPPHPAPPHDPPGGNTGNTVNGAKAYVAIAGDTVSKLAGRYLGGNTKANRDAIIAMNASLKENPNNVTVGKTYMIPAKAATATSARPATPPAAPAEQHHDYIVKDNDSLWRIASEQVGDPGAVDAIKELNKDVLKGSDVLHPNMRLRLPGKRLASVN